MQQRIGFGLPRRHIAITKASVKSWAVTAALIHQPTTRRENRSITAATLNQLLLVHSFIPSAPLISTQAGLPSAV
jgi:hypothetical protein